jgi:quinol monooxygenase YgiN
MLKLRNALLALAALPLLAAPMEASAQKPAPPEKAAGPTLYGLLDSMKAKPGQRDALIAILAGNTRDMPGCLSYVVYKDLADPDLIWVSEIWRSKAAHDASLDLPQVKTAMAEGRPLIASIVSRSETVPVAGLEVR